MSAGTIVAIVVVVIVVAALIAAASLGARRRRLRQRFGPEYDRAVEASDSRLQAEQELAAREKRVRHLDIRPLDPSARAGYLARWTTIQQQFVDSPAEAVADGQSLITTVMADRGYPTEDVPQIMADLSVDHASTLGHFRTAQDISGRVADGTASTEDLRQAMVHYRALFQELLGEPDSGAVPHDPTQPVQPVAAEPVMTEPVAAEPVAAGSQPAEPGMPGTRYETTRPAEGPDYAEAEQLAAQPDITGPDPVRPRPVGRHSADLDSGADVGQAELHNPEDAEAATSSRRSWRR
jgi:hypothetical protein